MLKCQRPGEIESTTTVVTWELAKEFYVTIDTEGSRLGGQAHTVIRRDIDWELSIMVTKIGAVRET